jgi:hypothetical protein
LKGKEPGQKQSSSYGFVRDPTTNALRDDDTSQEEMSDDGIDLASSDGDDDEENERIDQQSQQQQPQQQQLAPPIAGLILTNSTGEAETKQTEPTLTITATSSSSSVATFTATSSSSIAPATATTMTTTAASFAENKNSTEAKVATGQEQKHADNDSDDTDDDDDVDDDDLNLDKIMVTHVMKFDPTQMSKTRLENANLFEMIPDAHPYIVASHLSHDDWTIPAALERVIHCNDVPRDLFFSLDTFGDSIGWGAVDKSLLGMTHLTMLIPKSTNFFALNFEITLRSVLRGNVYAIKSQLDTFYGKSAKNCKCS